VLENGIPNSLTRSHTLSLAHTNWQSVRRFVYSLCFVHVRYSSMLIARHYERGAGLVGLNSESVLFIGTRFSNLYTAVDTPAEAA
jgi:hypothetical protein